jgi:hypothetical protein
MFNKSKKWIFGIIVSVGVVLFIIGAVPVLAQEIGLNYASNLGLTAGTSDPRVLAINIIRFLLTFLGLAAVTMILYGGWLWLSSKGEVDKIRKAKQVLTSAIIGLIIIIAAFAIVTFVLNFINTTLGPTCSPPPGPGQKCCPGNYLCNSSETCCNQAGPQCCTASEYCCPGVGCSSSPCSSIGSGGNTFYTQSTSPLDGAVNIPRNTRIRFRFNRSVDETTVDGTTFTVAGGSGLLTGTRNISGRTIEFVPANPCPQNTCDALNCLPANETITVTAVDGASGILSVGGLQLTCDSVNPCQISFTTNDLIDCHNPKVSLNFSQVCVMANNEFYAVASDDSGIDRLEFFVDGVVVPDVPLGNNPIINSGGVNPFDTAAVGLPSIWNGGGYTPGDKVNIEVRAYDLDSHSASDSSNYTLRPAHCCNGILDATAGEEGVDCGGECAACDGAACGANLSDDCVDVGVNCHNNDDRCVSRFCDCVTPGGSGCQDAGYASGVNNCCICQSPPIIDWVTPQGGFCDGNSNIFCQNDGDCSAFTPATCNQNAPNGAIGNLVTIGGRHFGIATGTVYFSNGSGGWIIAPLANDVASGGNADCVDVWQDSQVVVIVPAGAATGPIRIEEAVHSYTDQTDDSYGSTIPDFVVNTINRPGLCDINPNEGVKDTVITYQGVNLNNVEAYFGNLTNNIVALNSSFSATHGMAAVPNIQTGRTSTFVLNPQNVSSNFLTFRKLGEASAGPYISSFDPAQGREGQYVTIYGSGFGRQQGTSKVYFDADGDLSTTGDQAEANYDFPSVCENNVWRDNQILIKVPSSLSNGNYYIILNLVNWTEPVVSANQFTYNNSLPLAPSLCRLEPIMGPVSTPVTIWGEYFGNQATGLVRFQYNIDQSGSAISFWGKEGEADRVETTVPLAAASGPVRIVQSGLPGNGLNFTVGNCTANSDCGPNGVCCSSGSLDAGRCAVDTNGDSNITIDDCYPEITASVYEWDFSTEEIVYAGPGDPCYDPDSAVCTNSTLPECDPTLGLICDPDASCTCQYSDISFSSCQGRARSVGACALNYCPNSPGQCSAQPTPPPQTANNCDNIYCASQCSGCNYNSALDRCTDSTTCGLSSSQTFTVNNQSYTFTKYCAVYNGTAYWHYQGNDNCGILNTALGGSWINIGNQTCVWTNISNQCDVCSNGLVCIDDNNGDEIGLCGLDTSVCPFGYSCVAGVCTETNPQPICECCCDINENNIDDTNPSCCTPLICGADCGSGGIDNNGDGDYDDVGDIDFGLCSGCADAGTTQAEHDAACNCEGISGKFCDTSVPGGVCRDCAELSANTTECSAHNTCCVDAMDGNYCRGTGGEAPVSEGSLNYCAYYDCQTIPPFDCNSTATTTGTYRALTTCQAECGSSGSGLGVSCSINATTTCNVSVCTTPFSCLNEDGSGPSFPNSCGICCCNPADSNSCNINPDYPDLICQPDKGPCTGSGRGLCCGCKEDANCGAAAVLGCGMDTCCHARPQVSSTSPADVSENICRNAEIKVIFNQPMDENSFHGNVIMAGDYGEEQCPEGTVYLARAGWQPVKSNVFKRMFRKLVGVMKRILNPVWPSPLARAYTNPNASHIYCAVPGSVLSENLPDGRTALIFQPNNLLDPDRLYYVIIKGDENLDSSAGVLNKWGVGMNGPADSNNTFNGITYNNSYIFSFRTLPPQAENNGVCLVNKTEISPNSYLFQTTKDDLKEVDNNPNDPSFDSVRDRDKVFIAQALSADGQELAPVSGYAWEWNWNINNPNIVAISGDPGFVATGSRQLLEAQSGITDNRTAVTVTLNLTESEYSNTGDGLSASANVYVFLCNNPWPSIDPVTGSWEPWRDQIGNCSITNSGCPAVNYELYYCRDAGKASTYDDLPALENDTVVRGTILTCSDGSGPCSTTATVGESCGVSGQCQYEILKETYYFREVAPTATTSLTVNNPGVGGEVIVSWMIIPDPQRQGYKLYWGRNSGQYEQYAEIDMGGSADLDNVNCSVSGGIMTCTVSELENNTIYYLNLTSFSAGMAESEYYGEKSILVEDITPPPAPVNLVAAPKDGEVELSWDEVSGADSYKVYYGNVCGVWGGSENVGLDTDIVISGLTNGNTYCFGVVTLDEANNESATSTVSSFPFGRPTKVKATASSTDNTVINLSWNLDSGGVDHINVRWGTSSGSYSGVSSDLGSNASNLSVTGLIPKTTYYFIVETNDGAGHTQQSDEVIETTGL